MKPKPLFDKKDLPVITSVEVITYDDEIKKCFEALEAACNAAFHLTHRFSAIPKDVYEHDFNTPIAMMESILRELIGDE